VWCASTAPSIRRQRAAITSIAGKVATLRKLGASSGTGQPFRARLTTDERQRLKERRREDRELKRTNEILRKASAYLAQAELDRRGT